MPPEPRAARPDLALRAGVAAGVAFALLGWRGLLVPSLIRSIEPAFGRSDADVGSYFLATALAYATGSLVGGRLLRLLGPRRILAGAALLMAAGLGVQAFTADWLIFSATGVVVSLGASTCDVGVNGLVLDLFPHARGRALNLLHLMYSVAALAAPLALAFTVGAGVAWQGAFLVTAGAAVLVAIGLVATVPSDPAAVAGIDPAASVMRHGAASETAAGTGTATAPGPRRLPRFLLVLAVAVACYVAAESGTSDWLVRYLAELPLAAAGTALTMFWGGIAVGRVVFARIGNRFEPLGMAAGLALAGAAFMALAVAVPVSAVSPLLFGLAGTAFGPVFPLAVAGAGARMPGRSTTVSMTLTFAAVFGAIAYPPAMGLMSVTIGLRWAMLGTAVLMVGAGVAARLARGSRVAQQVLEVSEVPARA